MNKHLMNKFFRKKTIVVLFVVFTTITLTGCGLRYITNATNVLNKKDAFEFTVKKEVVDPITKIDIHTGWANVELIPAEDYYVEIDYMYWEEAPEYSLKDGILQFDDSDSFPTSYSINFDLENTIKIYLPEATVLSDLVLKNSSGDVTIGGFSTDNMDITVSYGDFTMKDAAASKANISLSSGASNITDFKVGKLAFINSYGSAKFTNINTGTVQLPEQVAFDHFNVTMSSGDVTIVGLNSNSIDVSNSYGNITCQELTAEELEMNLSSGNLNISKADLKDIDVTNSYGDVALTLLGPAANYALDLNTSYGKIKVGNNNYENHLILENGGSRNVIADLSSGDVMINFQDE